MTSDSRARTGRPAAGGDLSYAQARIWFLDQLSPGGTDYVLPYALRLAGELDVAAMRHALAAMVARHAVLRTRYLSEDGRPVQVVDEGAEVPLEVVDLRSLARDEADRRTTGLIDALFARPFDLAVDLPVRARLLRLRDDEHVLVLTFHHICFDRWSEERFFAGLGGFYRARIEGRAHQLPEPALTYAQFAERQRERVASGGYEEQLAHWEKALADLPDVELPADRPRPARRDTSGASFTVRVPEPAAGDLARTARRCGATPYMVLLAALVVVIGRQTGHTDVPVATAVAARTEPELEEVLGLFVNTVVTRTVATPGQTFRDLVRSVRDTSLEALGNQDLPFDLVVERLRPGRDLGRSPLAQVAFLYEAVAATDSELGGLRVSTVMRELTATRFDLTVKTRRLADGSLTAGFEYATALYDRDRVERLAAQYLRVLEQVTADPQTPVAALRLLDGPAERRALEHSRGPVTGRPAHPLHALVAARAAAVPDAIAVDGPAGPVRYAALVDRAHRIARRLIAAGVRPGERVGVHLDRDGAHGPDVVAALLGVWAAGAVYLPVDPAQPAARTAGLLADAGARAVLTRTGLPPVTAPDGAGVVALDDPALDALPAGSPGVTVRGDDVAYVIYTSGSTGRPKGVEVTHAGIRNRVLWTVEAHAFTHADRVLQKTTPTFDASVWELVAPLVAGGTVVLAPAGAQRDPALLVRAAAAADVTVLQFVPSVLRQAAEEPALGDCRALRLVLSAGEPLPAALAAAVADRTGASVVNTYGPTECAIDATFHTFGPADGTDPAATVPIGRPLDNAVAVVLDRDGLVAPDGVPGELYLGGAGVARGYLARPDLTAERFVPDPFGTPGGRLYRTGDLARRRADGTLEFLGRIDAQVKIRGVRVEPGEVEAVLAAHPAVAAAAVAVRRDTAGDARLVAWAVPAPGAAFDPDALLEHLGSVLPAQYVPSALVELADLPRTTSGKLDRKALPEPAAPRHTAGSGSPPATDAERTVAAVWADLLGVPEVSRDDDFFALGGHSLLAARAAGRLRTAFGTDFPLAWLFEAPTVAGLCRRVQDAGPATAAPAIAPAGRGVPLPLSAAQERLWLHEELAPGSPDYLVPLAWRLTGALETAALRGALDALVARHEILRTRYTAGPGGPRQTAAAPAPVPLETLDLSGAPDPLAGARAALAERAARGFDLTAGAPLRATLVRLAADEHVLALTFHHIAVDGWSLGLIGAELDRHYRALTAGEPAATAPDPLQYADFAQWHRGVTDAPRAAAHLEHWTRELDGVPVLELPLDAPRPAVRDGAGADALFTVDAATATTLLEFGRSRGATPFMVFLTVWSALLGRLTGQDDFAVGTPVTGREAAGTEGMLGSFVNTVALRQDLAGDPDFGTLLDRTRTALRAAVAHQDCPFDRVVAALRGERDLSRTPVFQTMFQVFEDSAGALRLGPLGVTPFTVAPAPALTDLSLVLRARQDGSWQGEFEYPPALFTAETVERAGRLLTRLMAGIAADPARPLSAQPLLDDDEARWDGDGGAAPADRRPLHEVVAAQVRATPGGLAVVSPAGSLTYAELQCQAGELAARLRAAGVRPGRVVASAMPRDHRLVVAWLGILTAGAVYLPVDASDPADRLAALLADTDAAALVTVTATAAALPAGGRPVLALDDPAADPAPVPHPPAAEPAHCGDLAYVIFTSGSTGRPKGVMVEHGSYVEHCHVMAQAYRLRPGAVFALLASVSFDASMDQIAAPLTAGAAVAVLDPRAVSPDELIGRLSQLRVTVADVTPVYYREIAERTAPGDERLASLELMSVGGDVVTVRDARRWAATGLPGAFGCTYGPTEATIACTFHKVRPGEAADRPEDAGLPIGRPLAGTAARVLDARMLPVPAGVAGELFIGGRRVARGYLGRPDLTAERFVPDPLGPPGARLYRTGDVVRRRADGVIEFVGRTDRQVKIRGYRVEPGEIEAVLAVHPAVGDAVVEAREIRAGDRQLVAYVVPAAGQEPDARDLREHLRSRLAAHLVPGYFVTLAALPVTRNGKVDRKALPAPDPSAATAARESVPPRDGLEEALCGMWQQVLGIEGIGVHDDFFLDLGGHSLLATRLLLLIDEGFGVRPTLRQLFEHTTVAAQSVLVRDAVEAAVAALGDDEIEALLTLEEGSA